MSQHLVIGVHHDKWSDGETRTRIFVAGSTAPNAPATVRVVDKATGVLGREYHAHDGGCSGRHCVYDMAGLVPIKVDDMVDVKAPV